MFSVFFEISEVEESERIGGDVPTERMEVYARVGFTQMLLDELWEGEGLIIAIADEFFSSK